MTYFRLYKDGNSKAEEVTKERACEIVSRNYKPEMADELLNNSSKEYPVNTMFALYWREV
jgi:hypothetical protein